MSRKRHVILISLDALSQADWETVKRLPNLSSMIKNGSYSKSLKSVYPTHTYTVHVSMVTGVYPDKHGIIHNHQLQPFVPDEDQAWYWYRHEIQAPTLYDLAHDHGLKTAGILWPVCGRSSINYNFPEIKAIGNENQALKIFRNGSLFYLLGLELRLGKHRKSTEQPEFDDYIALCAADTIMRKKPDLTLIHLVSLDSAKHKYRTDGPEIEAALFKLDEHAGQIVNAAKDAGIYDDTVFILLGDHGQINIDYNVHLNNLLRDAGLIDDSGNWRAYLQTAGGGAYLHTKDAKAEKKSLEVINAAMNEVIYGIEDIYDRETLDRLHAHPSIKYAIEAKPGYHFHDGLTEETIESYIEKGIRYATHGHSPEKPEHECIFIASGNGVKPDNDIGDINMVDIAPTVSDILGMEFYKCDGRSFFNRILT